MDTHRIDSRKARTGKKGAAPADRSAFTLIELLVVVAMLGIISVGIARIFKSVGDTVRGGKRVSNLNTYATLIERQMRKDFESMTRSGFLLIRNRNVGGTAPNFTNDQIRLAPGDTTTGRVRRGDEILFFASGDFASGRNPVYQDRSPRSTEAMVYFGHGLKRDPGVVNYRDPIDLSYDNAAAPGFGRQGVNGTRGPDQYASDWILARRAFLLVPPSVVPPDPLPANINYAEPGSVWPGNPTNPYAGQYEDPDRNIQIGLQPAAISPFRVIARDPRHILPGNNLIVRDDPTVQQPNLASGAVDIIASSLVETRNIVIDAQPLAGLKVPFDLDDDLTDPGGDGGQRGASYQTDLNPSANSTPLPVTKRMHIWMKEALPANSDGGRRMRVEPNVPDWTGSIRGGGGVPFDRDYKRTDQEMLTAANFVPHCTEFIVEYSFGKLYPANYPVVALRGQMIWHGQKREADLNGDGVIAADGSETIALPYGDAEFPRDPTTSNPVRGIDAFRYPYRRPNGTIGTRYVDPNVVGERAVTVGGANRPEYAYFAFSDPTWRMPSEYTDVNGNGRWDAGESFYDANGDGVRQAATEPQYGNGDQFYDAAVAGEKRSSIEPDIVPWPWPKLIRVTMSIVDPLEPLSEQTFQFTYEVPTAPEGSQF